MGVTAQSQLRLGNSCGFPIPSCGEPESSGFGFLVSWFDSLVAEGLRLFGQSVLFRALTGCLVGRRGVFGRDATARYSNAMFAMTMEGLWFAEGLSLSARSVYSCVDWGGAPGSVGRDVTMGFV